MSEFLCLRIDRGSLNIPCLETSTVDWKNEPETIRGFFEFGSLLGFPLLAALKRDHDVEN